MVFPAKIFEIKEEISFGLTLQKLKNFHEEEIYEIEKNEKIILMNEISDLEGTETYVSGIFSSDFIKQLSYRRKIIETPVTEEAPFWIIRFKNRLFLIIVAPSVARGVKKLLSNHVAIKLSKILFISTKVVVETQILHETLKKLHESNPEATRLIWFDQINLPGIDKLCLAGSDIADTQLYQNYLAHGQIWYVVFEAQKKGITLGITRNNVITLFSKSTKNDFINYIEENLLELVE